MFFTVYSQDSQLFANYSQTIRTIRKLFANVHIRVRTLFTHIRKPGWRPVLGTSVVVARGKRAMCADATVNRQLSSKGILLFHDILLFNDILLFRDLA